MSTKYLFTNNNNFSIPNPSSDLETPLSNQSKTYKKYQNKILNNVKKNHKQLFQEGFDNSNNINLETTNLTQESVNILNNTNQTPSQMEAANQLISNYNNLLAQYQNQLSELNTNVQNYLARISPTNPYLGKNIRISETGAIYYVTQQGVAKWYPTMDVYNNIVGNNGCPAAGWIELSVPNIYKSNNLSPGTIIPTTPPLIVGTPMVPGQSCGNEGSNIVVNNVVDNNNSNFVGCYADNVNSPLMEYLIGGTPASSDKPNGPWEFTYESCKNQAQLTGNSLFALQDVDPKTNMGYCGVSNNKTKATSLGAGTKINTTTLWSSNTSDGVNATLNSLGSIQVLNSSGNPSFQTQSAPMSNYIGCYQEACYSGRPGRAIPGINNGQGWNVEWNYDSCNKEAQKQGYEYFGIQYFQPNGLAQCTVTNDINAARQYGPANNCFPPNSDGIINGNWCSNSMYSTLNSTKASFYWLALQDDGNMCIYRGSGPGDIQGGSAIWCSMTNGKQQGSNPKFKASAGKTGANWMSSGTTLAVGEFIGSSDGSIYLIMQSDGNLCLNTSNVTTSCSKMSDGNYGAGLGSNAIYELPKTGSASSINNVYYIDGDANAHPYPSQNIIQSNKYSRFPHVNSGGNDLGPVYNSSVEECEQVCNNNSNCAGFVFAPPPNNICFPKSKGMWPYTNNIQFFPDNWSWTLDTYVKLNEVTNPPPGIGTKIANVDSYTAKNYVQSSNPPSVSYGLGSEISSQINQLNNLESQIESLANQLIQSNVKIADYRSDVYQQSIKDKKLLETIFRDYNAIENKINNVDTTNVEGILNDSDIVVLQKNYSYILWSILAIGVVIATFKIMKNRNL